MSDEREFNLFERRVNGLWEEVGVWDINKGDVCRMNKSDKLWICIEPRQTINGNRGLICDPFEG